jgi:hypothetical protein
MASVQSEAEQRLKRRQIAVLAAAQSTININNAVVSLLQQRRRRRKPRLPVRMPTFVKVLHEDIQCQAYCRMSIAEVSALCVRLVHDTGFAGHYKYTPLHRLVAYLIQLGHNYHYRHLRTHFDWADGSIRRNLTYWTDQVLGILDADNSIDNIRIWNENDFSDFRRQPHVTRFKNCIGCVDSIFIEIYRPGDRESQSRYFSWYKKMHTLFFTVICDRTGKIRYCDDGAQPRRQSDQNSIARSRLFLPPGLYLLGDGHYHEDVRCLTPYRYDELRSPHVTNVDRRRMIQYNKSLRS